MTTGSENIKNNRKVTTGRVIFNLFQIFLIAVIAYIIMVFISHFSVYNQSPDYKIADSFKAMFFKTDVPSEFFIYFYIFVLITVLLALTVYFITKIFSKK